MKQGGVGQVILIGQFVLQVHYNPYIDDRMDVVRKLGVRLESFACAPRMRLLGNQS